MPIQLTLQTAIGTIYIAQEADAIIRISFRNLQYPEQQTLLLLAAKQQLNAYFQGQQQNFSLPLKPKGTPFQQKVWQALQAIPYGQTRTYAQIAAEIGSPKACRAVGMANHHNPIDIVIPCHRVVGSNGALTGYADGLERKQFLLELERNCGVLRKR